MVYVVEVGDANLAFRAGSEAEAARIASSGWFARALDRFIAKRRESRSVHSAPRIATIGEFVAFQNMSSEFSDDAIEFLLARVNEPARTGRGECCE